MNKHNFDTNYWRNLVGLEGKTCIDCHKGIANLLPKEYIDPDD
jgi:nitrate/TMAO reductase-like tetraheme cytochrome c subunit